MPPPTTNYSVVTDPAAYAGIHLIESDGEPVDSFWHRDAMVLLIALVRSWFRGRDDIFMGGNNFIYFNPEQARNRDYRGPDFFFVKGVDRHRERRYWAVWEENGRLPNVVLELLSPTTEEEDRTTKFAIYEQTLRTPEYFMYDPEMHRLEGYRLVGQNCVRLQPNEHGRLWSEEMGVWIGTWTGRFQGEQSEIWLRLYTPEGQLVLLAEEEQQQRAEQAEQELARLRTLLQQQNLPKNGPSA